MIAAVVDIRAARTRRRLASLAEDVIRTAGRPIGADPRGIAVALGYELQPMFSPDVPADGAHTLRFRWAADPAARCRSVWVALAGALLAAHVGLHTASDAERLAAALATANNAPGVRL